MLSTLVPVLMTSTTLMKESITLCAVARNCIHIIRSPLVLEPACSQCSGHSRRCPKTYGTRRTERNPLEKHSTARKQSSFLTHLHVFIGPFTKPDPFRKHPLKRRSYPSSPSLLYSPWKRALNACLPSTPQKPLSGHRRPQRHLGETKSTNEVSYREMQHITSRRPKEASAIMLLST